MLDIFLQNRINGLLPCVALIRYKHELPFHVGID